MILALPFTAFADMHDMMRPRVPADQLTGARALRNPLPDTPDVVGKGQALYRGKGTCVNCHGPEGAGDGPVAASVNPSPRNFQHHGFWRHRTEGEIFWVIKHGSPGTSMIGFSGQLTDEEIWSIIRYEQSLSRGHGPRRGMHGGDGKGPPDRMENEPGERDCCPKPSE
jgi:mono/diheme cytochrome c family protein